MKNIHQLGILIVLMILAACEESAKENPDFVGAEVVWSNVSDTIQDKYENVYIASYDQVSQDNQNPVIFKYDKDGALLWKAEYEDTPVDGRAVMVTTDRYDSLWAVFSVDGGSNDLKSISKNFIEVDAFKNAIFNTYGKASGAAKALVIAKINPSNGRILRGTFFMSRTEEGDVNAKGKTNSMEITKMGFGQNQNVLIECHSWFKPPAKKSNTSKFIFHPDASDAAKKGQSYWTLEYELTWDLAYIVNATVK